jgi:hypothetical protein
MVPTITIVSPSISGREPEILFSVVEIVNGFPWAVIALILRWGTLTAKVSIMDVKPVLQSGHLSLFA